MWKWAQVRVAVAVFSACSGCFNDLGEYRPTPDAVETGLPPVDSEEDTAAAHNAKPDWKSDSSSTDSYERDSTLRDSNLRPDTGSADSDLTDRCAQPNAENEACDGVDNDCDGATDEESDESCPKTRGICKGAVAECTHGSLTSCRNEYGSKYELSETKCDGLDTDCDGRVDEPKKCAFTKFLGAQFGGVNDLDIGDNSGDIYLTGMVSGKIGGKTTKNQSFDAVLARLGEDGSLKWLRLISSPNQESGNAIAVDEKNGALYVAVVTNGKVGGGIPNGADDILVWKTDLKGKKDWSKRFGTSSNDEARAIEVDGKSNAIYLGGRSAGDFGGNQNDGSGDAFLVKIDANGNAKWNRKVGSTGDD